MDAAVDAGMAAENKDAIDRISIRPPDDFHVHLRDGEVLNAVAKYTARNFRRAMVMPNLVPPIRRVDEAMAYRDRILSAIPEHPDFNPLMALYLTDDTSAEDVRAAGACAHVIAYKLYPAGATTNSAFGVTSLERVDEALGEMERQQLVLCVHGEVTHRDIDVFDREERFVLDVLPSLQERYPSLRIVLEHATTAVAAAAVESAAAAGKPLGCTLTPHHLTHSRNKLFEGARIRPDMFCLPILKRESDRRALVNAATGKYSQRFFAGTDSAPHVRTRKLCVDGCAGIFNAPSALALYAAAFEEAGAIEKLAAFLSENGARFYALPLNEGSVTLRRTMQKVCEEVGVRGSAPIRPLGAGQCLSWLVARGGVRE